MQIEDGRAAKVLTRKIVNSVKLKSENVSYGNPECETIDITVSRKQVNEWRAFLIMASNFFSSSDNSLVPYQIE